MNVSTKMMGKFAGKWVVIDPIKDQIIAAGKTLDEIAPLVVHSIHDKSLKSAEEAPYSFLVPRKDEGPYILVFK